MLRTDAAKLRWLGVDMRPRWRRRVAVVVSYAAFLVVVWLHPWRIDQMPMLLFVGMNLPLWDQVMKDSIGTVARRSVLAAIFLGTAWLYWKHPAKQDRMMCDFYALLWIGSLSAVAYGKLVHAVWLRSSVRRWLGKQKRLESLDEYARHYYGERFAALTEEQQVEVGWLQRANPMGEWVVQGSGRSLAVEDERLRREDDRLRAQVQRLMTWMLIGLALVWSIAHESIHHAAVSGDVVASSLWTMAAFGLTLRQAIVLWSEEDPRVTSAEAEMELVERET
jgi:hypothetical protein